MPMVKLHQQTVVPFSIMQQLHMPPASMVQRFWTVLHASLSSQEQVSLNPPVHFSSLNVHRGTIVQLGTPATPIEVPVEGVPMLETPMPGKAIPIRSIIAVDINRTPFRAGPLTGPRQ
jgi:hypothetical protein